MYRQTVGRTYVREKAMQITHNEAVCATVRIVPSEHACDNLCESVVVLGYHPSLRATMLREKLNEITDTIQSVHKSIKVSEKAHDSDIVITLEYQPGYFNPERPFQEFVVWVECLWRKGLADYQRFKRKEMRSSSRC